MPLNMRFMQGELRTVLIQMALLLRVISVDSDKCTKHQFIHLLMATFKDLHIENSKNYKR